MSLSPSGERIQMWFRITPQTPLLMGDRSGVGTFQETEAFIPGGSLRGAVATRLLTHSPADFAALFDDRAEPYFGPAYLGPLAPTWPFPLTARTCKRYPGLSTGTTRDNCHHHGVVDVLLADLAYDLISDVTFPQRARLQPALASDWYDLKQLPDERFRLDHCSFKLPSGAVCDEAREPLQKEACYAWASQPLKADLPLRQRTTHVGINRARGVAQDQLLFTQERLHVDGSAQSFFASVSVPSSKADLLEQGMTGEHFVGRGRSRGNGRIQVQRERSVVIPPLADRLLDFKLTLISALLPYQQRDAHVRISMPGQFFSLTLVSPAILHLGGAPVSAPTPAALGLPDGVHLLRAWARPTWVGGWDSAARLPRRTWSATQTGSVFLYWVEEGVDVALEATLAQLEVEGIGWERERGYGQVVVCAPFHVYQEKV